MSKLIRSFLFFMSLGLLTLTPATNATRHPATVGVLAAHAAMPQWPAPAANARRAQLTHEWALTNGGPNIIHDLEVFVPIPGARANQRITNLQFSAPYSQVQDQYDQPVARFHFDEVAVGERVTLSWTGDVEIEAREWAVDPARVGELDEIPNDIRRVYTRDEEQYRLDSPLIRRAAKEAAGATTNAYWMARNIHDFIAERLSYDLDGKWDDAEAVYLQESGSCSEYTYLFIALARANGLPARYVAGTVLPPEAPYVDTIFHRWAEVYLPRYGWVPVDVVHDDRRGGLSHDYFAAVSDERFVTTVGGGDSDLLGWAYHSTFRYRYSGQRPAVSIERNFLWAPGAPELRASAQIVARQLPARSGAVPVAEITLVGINGTGDWSAQPAASWLRVDQPGGTTPAAVRVLADAANLSPGAHTARVVFQSRTTGAHVSVPIA
ncbi:MAG TPA: transglutaminase domain-containing protein, partial [Anaerolineae bacterium]|nr:transglutaminase domain-containing protein [Anaerolineae bacterium]